MATKISLVPGERLTPERPSADMDDQHYLDYLKGYQDALQAMGVPNDDPRAEAIRWASLDLLIVQVEAITGRKFHPRPALQLVVGAGASAGR